MRNVVPADIYEPPLYIAAQRALTVDFKYDRPKAHQVNRDLNIFRYGYVIVFVAYKSVYFCRQLKLIYANDNVLMRAALDHLVMLRVPHRQVHILIPDSKSTLLEISHRNILFAAAQTRKQSETLTQRLGKVRIEYPPAFRTLLLRGVPEWTNEEHVRTALRRLCEHDEYTIELKKDAIGCVDAHVWRYENNPSVQTQLRSYRICRRSCSHQNTRFTGRCAPGEHRSW